MFDRLAEVREALSGWVAALEPGAVPAERAARLVGELATIEKLAAAARTLLAGRVSETNLWRHGGERTPAHWLARTTGSSVGQAVDTLHTARRLRQLPSTEQALRRGALSGAQAAEITAAAAADPTAEQELVAAAAREGLGGLRARARAVRAAAAGPDERSRHEAVHRSRYLRHRTEGDGAWVMELRTTTDAGAEILAGLAPHRDRLVRRALAEGRAERAEALAADALVALARAGDDVPAAGGRAKVIVRVDHAALVRGHPEAGETCEVAGVGPVPVGVVREWMGDAFLAAVVTRGVDVLTVAHLGRQVTAHQRTALEWRDPTCTVAGCTATDHLEIDHRSGWARTGETRLDDLDRLCRWHHGLKTHRGHRLEPGTGKRELLPPDGPGPPTAVELSLDR